MAENGPDSKTGTATESITIPNDVGKPLELKGRLTAENSFFDEESRILTKQRLYLTETGAIAYSVVQDDGKNKERRAYLIRREGRFIKIDNGAFDIAVNGGDIVDVVKSLLSITDTARYEDFFEEIKKEVAANE